jgi:4-hydroxybenzoate polyprenyltransferase
MHPIEVHRPLNSMFPEIVRAMRPHQWLKNILVALPAIAAHNHTLETLIALVLAFVVYSLCASAVYVINDLVDQANDRGHPRKKHRPFAAGTLTPAFGICLAAGLFLISLAGSLALPTSFVITLILYSALSLVYTFYLKRFLMIDVVALACLYGFRVIAGAGATGVVLSEWLIVFCVFFFLSLALVKRAAELKASLLDSRSTLPGRGYRSEDFYTVQALAGAAGFVSVLVLGLYLKSETVKELYSHPNLLWGVGVILIFWIGRTILLAGRGEMHDDPVNYAVTDRVSVISIILAGIIILFST